MDDTAAAQTQAAVTAEPAATGVLTVDLAAIAANWRKLESRGVPAECGAVVKADILRPLVEVKAKIGTELSRRQANDPLAPVDRDPVPARFAEPVRRYYEDLGKDK